MARWWDHFDWVMLPDLRKHINASNIFNSNEIFTFMITFCEIWNRKGKALYKLPQCALLKTWKIFSGTFSPRSVNLINCYETEKMVIKFQSSESLLQVVSNLHISCLINSWGGVRDRSLMTPKGRHRTAILTSPKWHLTAVHYQGGNTQHGWHILRPDASVYWAQNLILPSLMKNEFKEQEDTISVKLGKRCNP